MKPFKLTAGFRSLFIKQIQEMDLTTPKRISISEWSGKRGLSSNGMVQIWYAQIGDLTGYDAKSSHQLCKIDFGLPIILQQDGYGQTIDFILQSTNFYNQDREHQIKIVSGLQITSKFSVKEMSQYLNDIQHFYGNCGLELTNGE